MKQQKGIRWILINRIAVLTFIVLLVSCVWRIEVKAATIYGVAPEEYTMDDIDYEQLANQTGLTVEQTKGLCDAYAKLFSGEATVVNVYHLNIPSSKFNGDAAIPIQNAVGMVYPYEYNITHYSWACFAYPPLVYSVCLNSSETLSSEERSERVDKLKEAVDAIFAVMPRGLSDVEKAVWLHDYIVLNCAYAYDEYMSSSIPQTCYSAYGALVEKKAVCSGYASAYSMLLKMCGIPVIEVSGLGNGGSHAWNEVQLDGKWYCVDVTWDDPVPDTPGKVRYSYLFLTDKELGADHTEQSTSYECNDSTFSDWFAHDINNLSYDNGWWYYNSSQGLIKTDIMGINQEVLMEDSSAATVYNGYIFYADGWNIMAKNIETGQITKVLEADISGVKYLEPYKSSLGFVYPNMKAFISSIAITDNSIIYTINDLDNIIEKSTGVSYSYKYITKSGVLPVLDADADYTEVDKAIAKVPADLSKYTVKTAQAVTEAVNAVVRGKKASQQAEVDAMAQALEDAVTGLVVKEGFVYDEADGKWYFYVDGEVDTTKLGMVEYEGDLWYVKNGVVDTEYAGLVYSGKWYYVSNGKQDTNFVGLTPYNNAYWYIKNGTIVKDYTGLVYYNGAWWYVASGKYDKTYIGLTYYNSNWWYIKNGTIAKDYNGLAYYNKDWWYITDGKLDKTYKGVTQMNGDTWFVKDGKIAKTTGIWEQDGNIYYVVDGKVDKSIYALKYYNEKWYYFRAGVVDWTYNTLTYVNNQWWYVNNGELDKTYTGLVPFRNQLWYVTEGMLDKRYAGVVLYEDKLMYVTEGKVDKTYTGVVEYKGKTYNVVNGVCTLAE